MHSKLLKILAVFTLGMTTFPFMLTNDVLCFGDISAPRMLAYYAAFLAVFAFGYGMGKLCGRGKLMMFLRRFVGGCTFFLSLILLLFTDNLAMLAASGVSTAFWYFLGERATHKNYADYFPMYMFGVYIAVTLLSYLFYGGMADDALRQPVQSAVITAFMAEICLTALLVNQSGIYDKASRRRETRSMLPKGLSGYNAALVLLITLAGLALYLFNDKIIWLIREMIKLVIYVILWLMRFNTESMEIQESEEGELGFAPENELDGWAPLLYIAAIVIIILLRRHIWSAIKNAARSIYNFFVREAQKSPDEPDFVDILEQTAPRKRSPGDTLSDSALKRRYRAETSPQMKFRLGYRILLRGMDRGSAGIVPSDTAAQQCAKGRKVYGEGLDGIERCYNAVRYNDEEPGEAGLSELDRIISDQR